MEKLSTRLSSSRRNDWFWYKNRSNPSSYAKVRAIGIQPCQEAKTGAPHQTPCLMGSANNSLFCASNLTFKMTSDQKTFNIKVVHIIETVKIDFGLVSIRGRLHLKSYPQGAASLNRTFLESSDKTNPNLTRVLDVNPSLFLAREVQPPLIYLRGDGRLNNTQSINSSTTFTLPLSFSLTLVLLLPRSSFVLLHCRAANLEALEPVRPT